MNFLALSWSGVLGVINYIKLECRITLRVNPKGYYFRRNKYIKGKLYVEMIIHYFEQQTRVVCHKKRIILSKDKYNKTKVLQF